MHKIGLKNKLQIIIMEKSKDEAPALFGARKLAKRLSKKGRAKAKEKRADRQEKKAERKNRRADRKEARAKRVEDRNPARAAKLRAKAKVKRAKADVKTTKANKERATELRSKKTIGQKIKSKVKKVKDDVKATKKKVVDGAKKVKRKAKAAIVAGAAAANATPMYDGPGGQETPKLGSMSDGMSQYGKKPGMGMYGKGSQITYGMGNTVGKPGNAKVGTGVNKNSSAMVQRGNILKHMSRNRKG